MLPSSPQFTELLPLFSIPGKVFILGEYAVLAGSPALVAAVAPRFEMYAERVRTEFELTVSERHFHPQSPAGRLISWADRMNAIPLVFHWEDPRLGQGGFGGSTAEFALVYRALAGVNDWAVDWVSVWKLYRELTAVSEGGAPSGADLVAQWNGGVTLFASGGRGPRDLACQDLSDSKVWNEVLVFSAAGQAGRKVATHEHLAKLRDRKFISDLAARLESPLQIGILAVKENSALKLGTALDEYAGILSEFDLEFEATALDRRVLRSLPGVLGVKGAGAMQADGILVVLSPEASAHSPLRKKILQIAQARNLCLVAEGVPHPKGVSVDSCPN